MLHRYLNFFSSALLSSLEANPLKLFCMGFVAAACVLPNITFAADTNHPNIVLIFTDDMGWGDLPGFTTTSGIKTPNIDRLIKEGTKFNDFYVAQAVCTASRAALMTGCYANRVGLEGALNHTSTTGISPEEELLPELLMKAGYATGMFGKWHLGLPPFFAPSKNGFQEWLGIPYSNDNTKYHPVLADSMPPLPLYDGNTVIEKDPDQRLFTKRLTDRSVNFIEKNKDQPFFLYVPHIMPHVPIFASDKFRGKSARGLYGDVIEEIDWSVGEIVKAIDQYNLTNNTLVIFTNDNGPFLSYGTHAGQSGVLRGGKLTTFEGGVRVPMVARWPGTIPAGRTCTAPIISIDLLPTFCHLAGSPLPHKPIDGINIAEVLQGSANTVNRQDGLVFYAGSELQALRDGKWKIHFPHKYLVINGETRTDGKPAGYGRLAPQSISNSGIEGIASRHGYVVRELPLSLYDLSSDISESKNVASDHPAIVKKLTARADRYRKTLGDSLHSMKGTQNRPVGRNDKTE
jgi:arylsulfatase